MSDFYIFMADKGFSIEDVENMTSEEISHFTKEFLKNEEKCKVNFSNSDNMIVRRK